MNAGMNRSTAVENGPVLLRVGGGVAREALALLSR